MTDCNCAKIILEVLTDKKNRTAIEWFGRNEFKKIVDQLIKKLEEDMK